MNNIAWRILTTILLLSVLGAVFWLDHPLIILGLLMLLWIGAAREWMLLLLPKDRTPLWTLSFMLVGLAGLCGAHMACAHALCSPMLSVSFFGLLTIAWLACGAAIFYYERCADPQPVILFLKKTLCSAPWGIMALGYVVVWPMFLGLDILYNQEQGRWIVAFLLFLVNGSDVAAYFGGRAFGRHLLAPRISPGKTQEGVWTALCVLSLCAMALALRALPWQSWFLFAAAVFCVITASVLGDLFESFIKRLSGVKDSGSILPGHGGILDRLDSLCAATPVFMVLLSCLKPSALFF